ncbi:MAG: hypothetical protein ACXVIY_11345, partial [Mucilaginibacter sp.]
LTTLILTMPFIAFAQSNYKPGYVVTAKGDTVKGFINYQEWDANPEAITFRKTADGQSVKYGVNDISAFSVDKLETFIRYSGKISTNAVDPDKVGTDAETKGDTGFRVAAVFFKVLEKGPRVALYSYRDDVKIRFYVGDAPNYTPRELIYRLTRTNTEKTYQKQLSAVALNNNELNESLIAIIARSEYSEDNILDIVSRINKITNTEYKKTHYSGSSVNLFVGAGLSICSTSSDAGSQYSVGGGKSYTSFGPRISFGIDLFANPATRALQFRLELSGAQNKFRSLYTLKVNPYKPTEVSFNSQELSVSPQVIYNFYNGDKFKIFVGVGVIFSHLSYSNAYFGSQNHDGSEASIATNEPFAFAGSDNALLAKAGVQIGRHFLIYGTLEGNVTVTENTYFGLSSSYKQIGINYLF